LTRENEALKARIAWLEQQVFGRKSEQTPDAAAEACESGAKVDSPPSGLEQRRRRGKQPGSKGYGRKRYVHLPTEVVVHDLPADQRRCPICGQPFIPFPGTEDSEVIEWEARPVRRVHKRTRYRPGCQCRAVPGIVTAPPPPKLIPKGLFAVSFWVWLLLEKFLFQRPLDRVRKVLALEGLRISQGTLTGGLRQIGELLQPVYTRILERNRAAHHWKMDETRWLVFEEVEGKEGYRWWLWVVITTDTVVYLLEPTRSAKVPKNHLPDHPEGIINADRYAAYLALGEKIFVAFCWSHVRRDFVRVQDGYRTLTPWAQSWITRINELFALNDHRVSVLSDPAAFPAADQAVRQAVEAMARQRDQELTDPHLHPAARKALESLRRHWAGCILFVEHPEIPMDNNESERRLREPALGRKNYYGSGSIWSGALTAICFTLFQTLLKNHLDPKKWLSAYFEACALHGGRPPEDLDAFLPWNLSPEQREAWELPEPFT
jgi:transposase